MDVYRGLAYFEDNRRDWRRWPIHTPLEWQAVGVRAILMRHIIRTAQRERARIELEKSTIATALAFDEFARAIGDLLARIERDRRVQLHMWKPR